LERYKHPAPSATFYHLHTWYAETHHYVLFLADWSQTASLLWVHFRPIVPLP
jgi:hypothetical protein